MVFDTLLDNTSAVYVVVPNESGDLDVFRRLKLNNRGLTKDELTDLKDNRLPRPIQALFDSTQVKALFSGHRKLETEGFFSCGVNRVSIKKIKLKLKPMPLECKHSWFQSIPSLWKKSNSTNPASIYPTTDVDEHDENDRTSPSDSKKLK